MTNKDVILAENIIVVNGWLPLPKKLNWIELNMLFSLRQVCELDIIFNFEKAYFILDELVLGGELQETSKKNVLKAIAAQDLLQEVSSQDNELV